MPPILKEKVTHCSTETEDLVQSSMITQDTTMKNDKICCDHKDHGATHGLKHLPLTLSLRNRPGPAVSGNVLVNSSSGWDDSKVGAWERGRPGPKDPGPCSNHMLLKSAAHNFGVMSGQP